MIRTLSIDIETYSGTDLQKSGVYRYAEDTDFQIILFAYAIDDEPVQVVDLTRHDLPKEIFKMLTDPSVVKTAFNANFERTCLAVHFNLDLDSNQWRCTAVHALYLGLPNTLDSVAKALNLNAQKDAKGKGLIRFFCIPNKDGERNDLVGNEEKWSQFVEYCRQDVEVERAIRKKIERFPVYEKEWRLWAVDQQINDRGVRLCAPLVIHAIACDEQNTERLIKELIDLTGVENPNSVTQLKVWLKSRGVHFEALNKEAVKEIRSAKVDPVVDRVLAIRQELAKTSVKKYAAMNSAICRDNRVRGLLQFYGANRSGRWAGRLVQIQNLPQNKLTDLNTARDMLLAGDYEGLEILFGNVPDVLSQLIRTAFIPSSGCRLVVSDFSAIEARVIAWLANERWRQEVFASHGKIYEASAAQMFKVPIQSIGKTSPERQKGKIAELALGYQGGVGALRKMGGEKMGLSEQEMTDLVEQWRKANPAIVKLWGDVQQAAFTSIEEKREVRLQHGLSFNCYGGIMFITLPSGRSMAYVKPKIEAGNYGQAQITYEGTDQTTKQFVRLTTYGGKLVENIVQAIARDCLAESIVRLEEHGYKIVMHVHDEVVIDAPIKQASAEAIAEVMGRPIDWADGLLLTADAFVTDYYKKD